VTSYTPRVGDRVKVELEVIRVTDDGPALGRIGVGGWLLGPSAFTALLDAGQTELVARAEPDWRPGQIGQHIETGELFIFDPPAHVPALWPWLRLAHNAGTHGHRRLRAEELAGNLVRCTVTPEATP